MNFYKVIVIHIDTLFSEIIDEKHFPDQDTARSYASAMLLAGYTCLVVDMSMTDADEPVELYTQ